MFYSFVENRAAALGSLNHCKQTVSSPAKLAPPRAFEFQSKAKEYKHSVSSHYSASSACIFCNSESHSLYQCDKFKKESLNHKREFVKQNKLCFNCLRSGHFSNGCKSTKCKKCNETHNTLLHETETSNKEVIQSELSLSNHCSQSKVHVSNVLLPTAIIKVFDSRGKSHSCRAIIDSGSEKSFIREACVQLLGLRRQRANVKLSGLTATAVGAAKGLVQLKLSSYSDTEVSVTVDALVLPKITCDLPQYPVDSSHAKLFKHLKLADEHFYDTSPIDILLGADIFPHLLLSGRLTSCDSSLAALETVFGWIIIGKVNGRVDANPEVPVSTHFTLCNAEFEVEKFWELEEIPNVKILTPSEMACEEHFQSTYSRNEDGRFVVRLPFRDTQIKLGTSREIAERRLKQNERSFVNKLEKKKLYLEFMHQYESLGHMQQCSQVNVSKETLYLPHHAVMKTSDCSSKFRVVFDASAKTSNGLSLNDKLMVGPTLQDDIASLLLRFRKNKIAMTADVVKMYRQILIHPDDTDYQHILWRESADMPVKDYRLLTVTYGTASAPYLATKCLQQLAVEEENSYPQASKVVNRDFYVDDLMTGSDSVDEALQLQQEIIEMLKCGGLDIKKWASNEPKVLENLPPEYCAATLPLEINDDIKTLGVLWNPGTDLFSFKLNTAVMPELCTKRVVLSNISKIFDPLGWVSPVVVKFKLFMQELWKLKIDWDENLPADLQKEWYSLCEDLPNIEEIKIPRYILQPNSEIIELHGFSDASERAYAAVVYVRTVSKDGIPKLRLIASKTRVAPLKLISLPRLELCGAVLLAKLINFTCRALQCSKSPKIWCWTDSTIVLCWLSAHPSRWKTFVAHRVAKIQNLLPGALWKHIDGKLNPADCASRGISLKHLKDFPLWWNGPTSLSISDSIIEQPFQFDETEEVLLEERRKFSTNNIATATTQIDETFDLLHKFSTLSKLKRVTAFCFRFISNCKLSRKERKSGFLTSRELDHALKFWIKCVQEQNFQPEISALKNSRSLPQKSKLLSLNPFIDAEGLLRVGGRLRHAKLPESQKFPLLLPKHGFLTELLISWYHITNLHAGPQLLQSSIQQQFWVISTRSAIRRVTRKCITCAKAQASTSKQMMGDLPSARITPSRPFLRCGVDFAGPFTVRMSKGTRSKTCKAYLALFVCFATRALHCELVSDLSTDAFLAALKRFISRRGKCADIYSDCGTNFVGAKKKLDELSVLATSHSHNEAIARHLSEESINWHFNPPAAPHMGGIWEAGIKSVKFHLKRIIANVILTYEELYTIIVQIEACLNSRPLSPMSSDPSDLSVLTPGHFLIGGPLNAVPETDFLSSKINRLTRWQLTQKLVQHFWKRWNSEYVSCLQQRPKWFSPESNLKIGNLVLIKDETLPPLKWRIGRIVDVFPGKDNCVRVASIKTSDGLFKRSVTKLCKLPLDSD